MTHQDPHSHSADAVHDHHAVEAQYVRQGRSGRRTLVILLLSAGAAAVLLIGMWAVSNTGFQRQDGAAAPAPVTAATEAPDAALADHAT